MINNSSYNLGWEGSLVQCFDWKQAAAPARLALRHGRCPQGWPGYQQQQGTRPDQPDVLMQSGILWWGAHLVPREHVLVPCQWFTSFIRWRRRLPFLPVSTFWVGDVWMRHQTQNNMGTLYSFIFLDRLDWESFFGKLYHAGETAADIYSNWWE